MKSTHTKLFDYAATLALEGVDVQKRTQGDYYGTRVKKLKKFSKSLDIITPDLEKMKDYFDTNNSFGTKLSFEEFNKKVKDIFINDIIGDYYTAMTYIIPEDDEDEEDFVPKEFHVQLVKEEEENNVIAEKLNPGWGQGKELQFWWYMTDHTPKYIDGAGLINSCIEENYIQNVIKNLCDNYWLLPEKEYDTFVLYFKELKKINPTSLDDILPKFKGIYH